jgi:hypothetical protein
LFFVNWRDRDGVNVWREALRSRSHTNDDHHHHGDHDNYLGSDDDRDAENDDDGDHHAGYRPNNSYPECLVWKIPRLNGKSCRIADI